MLRSLLAAFVWILPVAVPAQQSEPREVARPAIDARQDATGRVDPSVAQRDHEFVDQLRKDPARPAEGAGRVGVLLIGASGGDATLVAEEMDDRLIRYRSPAWSSDGRRIVRPA